MPPLGDAERLAALPALVPTDVDVGGNTWKESTLDVAIAGVCGGWG